MNLKLTGCGCIILFVLVCFVLGFIAGYYLSR